MSNNYKNQRGIILPVVLIFFSFLMLLGVTFVSVSGFQVQHSVSQVNRSQAYYIAKSSVESFSSYLIKESEILTDEEWDDLINDTLNKESNSFDYAGATVKIKIDNSTPEFLIIDATANYRNELGLSKIKLKLNNGIKISKNKSVIIVDNPDSLIKKPNSNFDESNLEYSEKKYFPDLNFPADEFIINAIPFTDLFLSKKDTFTISENSFYDSINLESKKNILYVDLNFGTRIIRVNNLIVDGDIILKNTDEDSKLIIYVEDNLEIGSNHNGVSINSSGSPSNLIIIYNQHNSIIGKNNFDFKGILYVPNSSVEFHTQSNIQGAIIAKTVSIWNNTTILPNSYDFVLPGEIQPDGITGLRIKLDQDPWNAGNNDE